MKKISKEKYAKDKKKYKKRSTEDIAHTSIKPNPLIIKRDKKKKKQGKMEEEKKIDECEEDTSSESSEEV